VTGKEFMKAVANGKTDIVELFLKLLEDTGSTYCVVGGLAVNAYAEPVVSLDLDLVVVSDRVDAVCEAARAKGFKIQGFEHSINLSILRSDLRIQLQTDPRYQGFLSRSVQRDVVVPGRYRLYDARACEVAGQEEEGLEKPEVEGKP